MSPERLADIRAQVMRFPGLPWGEGMVEELLAYIDWLQGQAMSDQRLAEIKEFHESKLCNCPDCCHVSDLLSLVFFLKRLIGDLQEEKTAYQRGLEDGKAMEAARQAVASDEERQMEAEYP